MAKIKMDVVYCNPNTDPESDIYMEAELDTGFEKRYPYRFELNKSGSCAVFAFEGKPTLNMVLPHLNRGGELPKNAYLSYIVFDNWKTLLMSFSE